MELGSSRLIGGVPRIKGVQNGVGSGLKGINTSKKNHGERRGKKKRGRRG